MTPLEILALLGKYGPTIITVIQALEQGKVTEEKVVRAIETGLIMASDIDMEIEFKGQAR